MKKVIETYGIGKIAARNKYRIGLIIIIISLIIYKIPFLNLPYYWDEAWPYGVAVKTMYDHGLSLFPTAIPSFVSRGHPLLFHFLAAAWLKVFGVGIVQGHCFALTISISVIISIFQFCRKFFSERIGLVAALLFSVQPILISQSVFLLPEMMVALWTILAMYYYFQQRYLGFVVFALALLLTKESGGILILTLFFSEFLLFIYTQQKNIKLLVRQTLIILMPLALASVYFIIQKIQYGWFLYPFYMNYISSNWLSFKENLPSGAAYLLLYYGRNGFTFFIVLSLVIIFSRKYKFDQNEKKVLPTFTYFIVLFIVFSSINYFIPRYLSCIFPLYVICGAVLIDKALGRYKSIYSLVVVGLTLTGLHYYFYKPNTSRDSDYSPSIRTSVQLVHYCEEQKMQDKYIFATCLFRYDLSEKCVGYLYGQPFTHLESEFSGNTAYCIFSKDEYDGPLVESIKATHKLLLVKRFTDEYAWCELYKVIKD